MGMPEGYKWREGDRVSVEGTVTYNKRVDSDMVHVKIDGHYSNLMLDPSKVDLVQPFFEAGDKVRMGEFREVDQVDGILTVIAVADDSVWVKAENGTFQTIMASFLTFVPDEEPELCSG